MVAFLLVLLYGPPSMLLSTMPLMLGPWKKHLVDNLQEEAVIRRLGASQPRTLASRTVGPEETCTVNN